MKRRLLNLLTALSLLLCVAAAVLWVRHGSQARRMAIPLVPFLAFGAIVALFAGDAILDWYLAIFT